MITTVVTPTYNRGYLLGRLFESLKLQTNLDFEWIIVNDGSADNTDDLVRDFMKTSPFKVTYIKKENGGKHTALNAAYDSISTPITFIVDSDDYLTIDAIQTIADTYNKYKDEKDLCGFSFLRGKPGGGYLSDSGVPENSMKESYVECRMNRGIGGDMAEAWITKCLIENPFPVYQGERFLSEDIIWVQLSYKYKMRFFNKVIYMSDYLDDGLTKNRRKHNISSPNGCVKRAEVFLKANTKWKIKIVSMLQLQIYGRFAGKSRKELKQLTDKKMAFDIFWIPSMILWNKWNKEFRK